MKSELQNRWPAFGRAVRRRLEEGARQYGDSALTRPTSELAGESLEELEDLAGWSFLLWHRFAALMDALPSEAAPMSRGPDGHKLLRAKEVAERLGLTKARVYALARQGQLGAVRVGERGVRFSEAGLIEWLQRGGSK